MAGKKQTWVAPKLEELDIKETLTGPLDLGIELAYALPDPRVGQPYSHS